MARYRRSVRRSSSSGYGRRAASRITRRRSSRAAPRRSTGRAQTVRIVVQSAAPVPVATVPLGMRQADAPKKSKF